MVIEFGATEGRMGVFSRRNFLKAGVAATALASGRERTQLDADWRFHRGDLRPQSSEICGQDRSGNGPHVAVIVPGDTPRT